MRGFRTSGGWNASRHKRDAAQSECGAARREWDATRGGWAAAAAAAVLACFASSAAAANKNPPTIKDLDAQQVDVNTDPPQNIDANKTMDSYKRFLDLNAGDAALRAEALRRLGDLNLESSESERIERELVTNEGLRATEAIHLYSALLKTYPKYERNDSVLYQLARAYELNAQPDKALASLDQLQQRLADVSAQQNRFLQALAIRELESQKQRISTYQIQARYELAAIYDHAANDKPKAKP